MADGNLEALRWVKDKLGRGLWPREREFIETGGLAYPDDFDWDDPKRPETATEENRFDAGLIRWILTEEIPGVTCRHEGVFLVGLWIENKFNLEAIECGRSIFAASCVFELAPLLRDSHMKSLVLSGSKLPGLSAHRISCSIGVLLRTGFEALDTVDFSSARISGSLDCSDGSFFSAKGPALNCDSAEIGESVFLNKKFVAIGGVDFIRAQISGQLACVGGTFEAAKGRALNLATVTIGASAFLNDGFTVKGEVNLVGAQIKGNLECQSSNIRGKLLCDGATIGGGFFWRSVSGKLDDLSLIEAKVGPLADDVNSWLCAETPKISGFRYDSLQSDMTVQDRLSLLARKWERVIPFSNGTAAKRNDFDPQPYSQLAKVYDSMGHRMDAAKVRFARDERLMWAAFFRAMRQPKPDTLGKTLACVSLVWGYVYRDTFGYGHAPFKALRTALLVLIATWWLADHTFQRGEFAPASPVVLTSADWLAALKDDRACPTVPMAATDKPGCIQPLVLWTGNGSPGDADYLPASPSARDYETFSPALYALDLFLPLDTLAQEESWAPSKDRGPWGWTLYWGRWLIQLSGWLLLTTAAAVFSGVLGKKD